MKLSLQRRQQSVIFIRKVDITHELVKEFSQHFFPWLDASIVSLDEPLKNLQGVGKNHSRLCIVGEKDQDS